MNGKRQSIRRLLAGLLAAVLAFGSAPQMTFAEETEVTGSSKSAPEEYKVGTECQGVLLPGEDPDTEDGEPVYYDRRFYRFTVETTGRYAFATTGDSRMQYQVVEDPDFESSSFDKMRWRSWRNNPNQLDLIGGTTYYLTADGSSCSEESVSYSFSLTLDEKYVINTPDDPIDVTLDTQYDKTICGSFREDSQVYPSDGEAYATNVYRFTLPTAGRLTMNTVSPSEYDQRISWWLRVNPKNEYDEESWSFSLTGEESGFTGQHVNTIDMIGGTYFICVKSMDGEKKDADYSFRLTFDPIVTDDSEKTIFDTVMSGSNNTWETAAQIDVAQKYVAQSVYADYHKRMESDWFKFTLAKDSKLYLSASTDQIDLLKFRIYEPGTYSVQLISTVPCPYEAGAGNPLAGVPLVTTSDSIGGGKTSTTFKAGVYYISVEKERNDLAGSVGNTGAYRFEIRNSIPADVQSVQIMDGTTGKEVRSVQVEVNKTKKLTALVLPEEAADRTVQWSIDSEEFATVDAAGLITGLKEGSCTLTVTTKGLNSKGEQLTASCTVNVVPEGTAPVEPDEPDEPDIPEGQCPPIVVRQKIYLYDPAYFGGTLDKTDKWDVYPKYGTVARAKGVFTATKAGEVTVTRKVKVDGEYDEANFIKRTFTIVAPAYPLNDNNKPQKIFTIDRKGGGIIAKDVLSTGNSGIVPTGYAYSKNRNFDFNEKTGEVIAKKNGSCIVSVYYGDIDKKYAAKYTYTVKAVLPKLTAKLTVKAGAKNPKRAVVTLNKIHKNRGLGVTDWHVEAIDPVTGQRTGDLDCVYIEPDEKNALKCKVWGLKKGQKAWVVAVVDRAEYYCEVIVK
ncbi:MAG: Ig-like domain-containing protein [Lachnospiraceae bacterium]|nr:Ig-like domain-containing protein [Lachnospiraceae bacterium]